MLFKDLAVVHSGDGIDVSRGFCDVKGFLKHEGFVVKMPNIIPPPESQLSDVPGNHSQSIAMISVIII